MGQHPDYRQFLNRKVHEGADSGFEPTFMPAELFDFQQSMVDYAVGKGRAALFEDCGLGKTVQFLTWAQNVVEHTNRPVLVTAPLAVAAQIVREAGKFDIEASRSSDGTVASKIVVTNYERLSAFNPADFAGVVCDESSILKSFDGARKAEITDFMRKVPYRLLATASVRKPGGWHGPGPRFCWMTRSSTEANRSASCSSGRAWKVISGARPWGF